MPNAVEKVLRLSPSLGALLLVLYIGVSHTRAEPQPAMDGAIERVVDLFAVRNFWPPTPDAAEQHFRALLGPLQRQQPMPGALTLVGTPVGPVARTTITFSRVDDQWYFVGASIFMSGADPKKQQTIAIAAIRRRLGKPSWSRRDNLMGLRSIGWTLRGAMELMLAPSSIEGEKLLMLTVSQPTGP